mmetsp:Transcript_2721/g.4243  ORF Transcript_2721/g.4243 Transcript_2721/m.4243 type:complete len:389 (-) Transcript_2721:86-1252(-)
MESIFYSSEQKFFWEKALKQDSIESSSILAESFLLVPKSNRKLKKLRFVLTLEYLYIIKSSNRLQRKKSNITFGLIEPFVESDDSSELTGFRVTKKGVFQDFYVEKPEVFDHWLSGLQKVCVFGSFFSELEIVEGLGVGLSADVNLVKDKGGKFYAAKSISKSKLFGSKQRIENLKREILINRQLEHPGLVQLHRVYECKNFVHLIFDYLDSYDLCESISAHGRLTEEFTSLIIRKVLSTIHYLHAEGVTHRDIKLENILVGKNFEVKVIDLGFATKEVGKSRYGSPGYFAPEVIQKKPYNQKADIFSTGVMLYCMLFGDQPFQGDTAEEIISKNLECKVEFPEEEVSEEAKDLVLKMVEADPQKRITAAEAMLHPWILRYHNYDYLN